MSDVTSTTLKEIHKLIDEESEKYSELYLYDGGISKVRPSRSYGWLSWIFSYHRTLYVYGKKTNDNENAVSLIRACVINYKKGQCGKNVDDKPIDVVVNLS